MVCLEHLISSKRSARCLKFLCVIKRRNSVLYQCFDGHGNFRSCRHANDKQHLDDCSKRINANRCSSEWVCARRVHAFAFDYYVPVCFICKLINKYFYIFCGFLRSFFYSNNVESSSSIENIYHDVRFERDSVFVCHILRFSLSVISFGFLNSNLICYWKKGWKLWFAW